jgi:RHS repeat-associated protein
LSSNFFNSTSAQKGTSQAGKNSEISSKAAPGATGATSATDKSVSTPSTIPSISLPKGGGAMRGIGEKFTANPVTGTGSLSVPIFTSPGRSGFGPQLSLSYDSGSGNGPFGFGWGLSLPSITRKTDKGLPIYRDAALDESDVFILSGAEDLVPVLKKDEKGEWELDEDPERDGYIVRRYRPRIEGLFARIERWTRRSDGDTHWRSISKDNVLTVYGKDEKSRIYDPVDKSRIFSWLICESYDDKGNAIVYEYAAENDKGVDLSQANERNRSRIANRYIKRIWYGNRQPLLLDVNKPSFRKSHLEQTDFSSAGWMFEVVFDYFGEDHYMVLPLDSSLPEAEQHRYVRSSANVSEGGNANAWLTRPDPFSTYRAGFEVRTYRRCQRVLMFHRFPELGNEPYLVRSTEFDYSDFDYSQGHQGQEQQEEQPIAVKAELEYEGSTCFASFIQSVTQSGYVLDKTKPNPVRVINGFNYLRYLKKSLPPLEFEYSLATIHEDVKEVDDAQSLENLPSGLDGTRYQWADLDGEGLSGILTEQAGAWFYKRNMSSLPIMGDDDNGKPVTTPTTNASNAAPRFAPIELLKHQPSPGNLGDGGQQQQQLMDLSGDGQLDLVQFNGPLPGFFERTTDEKWETFVPFTSLPNIRWDDPNLKFIDLTGDGHADILITEDHASFVWYQSLAEQGFVADTTKRVCQSLDEEKAPRLVFSDGTQSIYLADMSGDGLTDLVRILNGEVCYWPNLGYGRFGAKVTMDNAPWFDTPDQFDQKRIRLADMDGSGVTDIIYLSGCSGVKIYFNQSGNRWSDPHTITNFPHIDNLSSSIQAADLLGNGTACLVWSSALPADSRRPIRYIDFMGGQKPHLLVGSKNNLGAETRIHYAASTKFYLADKAAGKPWITRLPFPVHVIERVETYDWISRNRFVTRYGYHHGYFDGTEREFRGFGMVEQWDTEEMGTLLESGNGGDNYNTNWEEASFVPPRYMLTWFHTGAYLAGGNSDGGANSQRISKQFEEEYYKEGDISLHEQELDQEQTEAMLLPDTVLSAAAIHNGNDDGGLTSEEAREACRALKGSILRQEIYALDRHPDGTLTEESDRPYRVSEHNYTINCLQPRGENNKHAVFFVHPRETIDFHYERKLYDIVVSPGITKRRADPRVTHNVTLEVDDYGNVLKSIAIGYGRRQANLNLLTEPDQNKQTQTLITYTENNYTNAIIQDRDAYRTPLQSEMRIFEVINFDPPDRLKDPAKSKEITNLFLFDKLKELIETKDSSGKITLTDFSRGNWDIPYEDVTYTKATVRTHPYRRLIEHVRILYSCNKLNGLLPLNHLDSLALPGETYKLAFTPGLLSSIYQRKPTGPNDITTENLLPNPSAVLTSKDKDGGAYVDLDKNGNYWIRSGRIFYWHRTEENPSQELEFASKHFFMPHRFSDAFDKNTTVGYDSNETDISRNHNLLLRETQDPLSNTVFAGNNYRVLKPIAVRDPNGTISEALFDALGLVVATAIHKESMGDSLPQNAQPDLTQKEIDDFFAHPRGQVFGDRQAQAAIRLGTATSCIIYDVNCYYRARNPDKPPYSATVARETHVTDSLPSSAGSPLKLQVGFSYSDGFSREIQNKIQAEPGPVKDVHTDLRWIGSGWTIFNNKGKPVRKYEPFFDNTHEFKFARKEGVSSTLFYDPAERVVATLHPNNTYEKVVFDPWHQRTYDSNDTVMLDPRIDEDIDGYVAKYFRTQHATWQTWYQQRIDGAFGTEEQKAAQKTETHTNSPSLAYFDTLGRTFLTVTNNGKDANDNNDMLYRTRTVLDIEGNQREIIDAEERIIMRYGYDMLGNHIKQESVDAGTRWVLNNVYSNPIRNWDSRSFNRSMTYDALQRPMDLFVTDVDTGTEFLGEKITYGESQPNPEATNHRLKVWEVKDAAGLLVNERYDFKGNLMITSRQLLSNYKIQNVDWSQNPQLEKESFVSRTNYDALNRPIQIVAPHSINPTGTKLNVSQPVYNEAKLLERLDVWIEQNAEPNSLFDAETASQHSVKSIVYNTKGQRELIEYGNGVWTQYEYDPQTFRLVHMHTRRKRMDSNGEELLQDLYYTYDPVGNITHIRDNAQQDIFIKGRLVEPSTDYRYDPVYRLKEAIGREHLGLSGSTNAPEPTSHTDDPRVDLNLNDPNFLGTYNEKYTYDSVGNIKEIDHTGTDPSNPGWTRVYIYNEDSLIEADKKSNRLSSTIVRGTTFSYKYDPHGNMTIMPHFDHSDPNKSNVHWNFKDELQKIDLDGGGTSYYVYDASGQRVRKVHEHNGLLVEERIYISNFEVYRKLSGAGLPLSLERNTLHVMDNQQRIAVVEIRTQGNDGSAAKLTRYQMSNHLGSVSLELDDGAQIISYEEYYPFGSTSYQAVRSQTETSKRYRYTAKERDEENGMYYHGARYYASWLGRWISVDPVLVNEAFRYALTKVSWLTSRQNQAITIVPRRTTHHLMQLPRESSMEINHPFAYTGNRPVISHDPDGRDAILIAFPDFRPEIPGMGRPLALGHAGVLLIDNRTGATKYYEYGRYDTAQRGLVRTRTVPNVVITDGQPTHDSVQRVLARISQDSGHGGRILGAYIKSDKFAEMKRYAEDRMKQNSNPNRTEYNVLTCNCATFAADVVNQDPAVARPSIIISNSPNNVVDEYIEEGHRRIEFSPSTRTTSPPPQRGQSHGPRQRRAPELHQ